jgi:hypothetical protein
MAAFRALPGSPRAAEGIEVHLVQDHGTAGDHLLALEAVDLEHRGAGPVQFGQALLDGIEALYRTAVVVFPVADDQLLGQAGEFGRIA